ncbi:TPA: C39 family peptidase [Candidatus Ventrenecus stercoripullorum]|nr:C39 family peptidase [Candidatus Ventrenecus stercoripullorum]
MNLHYSIPDFPIIIWIGTDYLDNPEVFEWYSSDGKEKYTAPKNTHTVLVMGYDKENFYIIDPLKEGITKVERSILEASYNAYGRQKFFMNFGRAGLFK